MLVLEAPAKINLTLEILSRRPDGFHTLRSVMVPVGLYDAIELRRGEASRLSSEPPGLERDNLVMRALAASGVRAHYHVHLRKGIPVGGGLGGGSSDAAAILRASIAGDLPAQARDWLATARELGSDVPFFLAATAALVEGTGERVTALGAVPPWWALVVRPAASVPTATAYALLDEVRAGMPRSSRTRATSVSLLAAEALQRGDFEALQAALFNDFHEVVLRAFPEIARSHAAMVAAGAASAMLSGSGSCLFALFEREEAARSVLGMLRPGSYERAFAVPFVNATQWR